MISQVLLFGINLKNMSERSMGEVPPPPEALPINRAQVAQMEEVRRRDAVKDIPISEFAQGLKPVEKMTVDNVQTSLTLAQDLNAANRIIKEFNEQFEDPSDRGDGRYNVVIESFPISGFVIQFGGKDYGLERVARAGRSETDPTKETHQALILKELASKTVNRKYEPAISDVQVMKISGFAKPRQGDRIVVPIGRQEGGAVKPAVPQKQKTWWSRIKSKLAS